MKIQFFLEGIAAMGLERKERPLSKNCGRKKDPENNDPGKPPTAHRG